MRLFNGGAYIPATFNITSANAFPNKFSSSFVFDKSANGGSDELYFRIYMLSGDTIAFDVNLKSIKLIGKFINPIIKKDWSDKVDMDSFDIKMMNLSRRIDFSYVKDEKDHASNVYTAAIPPFEGIPYRYGDRSYDKGYTSLTGVETISSKPFASTIVKSLNDYTPLDTFFCPAIYTKKAENEFSVYKNKPRLLYDNGVVTTGATYSSPSQNDDAGFSNESEYLQFTHFSEFDNVNGVDADALDLNFGDCQLFINNEGNNTLVNEYWSSYYGELYHEDTRIYSVKLFLNNNDIVNFKFTDIIVIENSEFRVNNINYNAGSMSKVELIKLT